MPAIRIRAGLPADLPALESVERETAALFSRSDLPLELAQPLPVDQLAAGMSSSLVWVAEEACAGPVGFVLCERRAACLHIREMDVRPSFGRKGIGARLLFQACAAAGDLGLPFITLTTFSHLPWNAPFYARRGFTVVEDLAPFPHLATALRREHELGLRNRIAMARNAACPSVIAPGC
jgi:GNAT superfamily N-acetyltransferase